MWGSTIGGIVTLSLSLLTAPLTSQAQPAAHVPRLGLLIPSSFAAAASRIEAFRQGLHGLGRGCHLMPFNGPKYEDRGVCAGDRAGQGDAKIYPHIIAIARSGHVNFAVPVTGPIQEEICSDHVARIDPSLGERVCITVDNGAEQLATIVEDSNGYP